jgi:molecular chaperone GrpE (heat shock protein)
MATTIQQIGDIQTQFEVLQKETVSFALAESDQSLDVARKVKLLQAELRKLVELCRLTVIDPPRGSAFDQQRHNSMGTMRTDPGCSRGTIAAVLSRGLLGPESEVLKLAEVKVYD